MAQATKMGADVATRESRRMQSSGYSCVKCGKSIAIGELMMVQQWEMDEHGRARRVKNPYHRGCY